MKFRLLILFSLALLISPVVLADTVSWAGIAPNWTALSNPFSTTSAGGITVTGSMASASAFATHQCLIPTFITPCLDGAFLPGDPLLWTNYTTGPLLFSFSSGLQAISTQIQTIWYGPFTATLTAYGSGNVLLGTTTISGNTAGTHDGTADVLGFFSGGPAIFSIAITATSAYPNSNYDGLFINQLNLTPSPIPEPATLLLVGSGLAVGWLRRRKRT